MWYYFSCAERAPLNARVVELVDSLASGASARKGVRVRLPPRAPRRSKLHIACSDFFQKSERAHCAAPPFQIEPASLGFDLVLGAISKENRFYPLITSENPGITEIPGFFVSVPGCCPFVFPLQPGFSCAVLMSSPPGGRPLIYTGYITRDCNNNTNFCFWPVRDIGGPARAQIVKTTGTACADRKGTAPRISDQIRENCARWSAWTRQTDQENFKVLSTR